MSRWTDLGNGRESLEINICIDKNLVCDKDGSSNHRGKDGLCVCLLSVCMYFFNILFWNNYRFTRSCKEMYREVPCSHHPTSANVGILYNCTMSTLWNWHWYSPQGPFRLPQLHMHDVCVCVCVCVCVYDSFIHFLECSLHMPTHHHKQIAEGIQRAASCHPSTAP